MNITAKKFENRYKKKSILCIIWGFVDIAYALMAMILLLGAHEEGALTLNTFLVLITLMVLLILSAKNAITLGIKVCVADYSEVAKYTFTSRIGNLLISRLLRLIAIIAGIISSQKNGDIIAAILTVLFMVMLMRVSLCYLGNYRYGMWYSIGTKALCVTYRNELVDDYLDFSKKTPMRIVGLSRYGITNMPFSYPFLDLTTEEEYVYEIAEELKGTFQGTYARNIKKLGWGVSVIIILIDIGLLTLGKKKFTTRELLFFLSISSIPMFILALIFPGVFTWYAEGKNDSKKKKKIPDLRENESWKETHFNMMGVWLFIQYLVFLFILLTLRIRAQVDKGFDKLCLIWGIVSFLVLLMGYLRFGRKRPFRRQFFVFSVIMMMYSGILVGSTCFYLSSDPVHSPCTFVSKSVRKRKNITDYKVEVKLEDGSIFSCVIPKYLYEEVETTELVICHQDGPFGITYQHVHAVK